MKHLPTAALTMLVPLQILAICHAVQSEHYFIAACGIQIGLFTIQFIIELNMKILEFAIKAVWAAIWLVAVVVSTVFYVLAEVVVLVAAVIMWPIRAVLTAISWFFAMPAASEETMQEFENWFGAILLLLVTVAALWGLTNLELALL